MRLSQEGFELLKQLEGAKNHVYKDSAGLDTIGVGHLLNKSESSSGKIFIKGKYVRYDEGLTNEEIDDLFRQDLVSREQVVDKYVRVELDQNQFDALVSFVFNVGRHAFSQSKLLQELNKGNYDAIPDQLRRWKYAAGKVIQGLVNRREAEIALWSKKKEATLLMS